MDGPGSSGMELDRAAARRRLKRGALIGLALLAAVNAVGIYLNLYVALDDTTGYDGVFSAMFASVAGVLHVVLALMLFLGALGTVVVARRSGNGPLLALSLGALVSFLVAAYSGYHFVAANDDLYSFTMEMGFLGAVLCEAGILALVGGPDGSPPIRPTPVGGTATA